MRDREKILSKIREYGADALIILDESTRYWATEFRSSAGVVIISEKETALFLDGRYVEKANSEKPNAKIYPCSKGIISEACNYICQSGFKSVIVDESRITLSEYKQLSNILKDINLKHKNYILNDFISIKNDKEISLIKEAVKITDECFLHILNVIKKGITEADVAAEINYFINKRGCETAFDTIAVSGIKSSMPHGCPDRVELTENSFLTMDFGAKFKGYCADLTRTVVLGTADEEMKFVYETVQKANNLGISAVKEGIKCSEVDYAVRNYISNKGFGDYFTHSTGHSLGVEIHESPSVSSLSQSVLQAGNVITIEPGIYIPNKYGVRIEDTVLITPNGAEVLSASPKNLIEIKI